MPKGPGHQPVLHTKKHLARIERERRQTRGILTAFIVLLVGVVGALLYGYWYQHSGRLQQPAAKVGSVAITTAQLETRVRLHRRQLIGTYYQYLQYQQFGIDVGAQLQQIQDSLGDPVTIGRDALEQMIDEEVIRQEAGKRGITVSPEEVQALIENYYGYFPAGSPTPSLTPTAVTSPTVPASAFSIVTRTPTAPPTATATSAPAPTEVVSATGVSETAVVVISPSPTATITATAGPTVTPLPTATPMTAAGFQDLLSQTLDAFGRLGLGQAEYKQLFEDLLLRQKVTDAITAEIAPVEEQVWARHILLENEALATGIRERLLNGEDFASLARQVSKDSGSAVNGGDLGWFRRGVMVDAFEKVAFELPAGEISEPVQSDFGWHIIQVIARQDRPLTPEQLQQERDSTFQTWLQTSRAEYAVQVFDQWEASVPTEPSLNSFATEQAQDQLTALAEQRQSASPTVTPVP